MSIIIKNCRGVKKCNDGINRTEKEKQRKHFRAALDLKEHDIIITKEESTISKIMKVFAKEKIKLRHSVLDCYIELYFPEYRLAVEIDGKGHLDRDENKEKERENKIKETLKCEFIRINADKAKFGVFVEIGKIYDIIDKIK